MVLLFYCSVQEKGCTETIVQGNIVQGFDKNTTYHVAKHTSDGGALSRWGAYVGLGPISSRSIRWMGAQHVVAEHTYIFMAPLWHHVTIAPKALKKNKKKKKFEQMSKSKSLFLGRF